MCQARLAIGKDRCPVSYDAAVNILSRVHSGVVLALRKIMPLELSEETGGRYLVIRATGTLIEEDYRDFIPKFERLAPHTKKLRVLFDIRGLHGWNPAAAWEDIKFDMKHYSDIERLAIVGDTPWQHGLATLFAPFTKATTRYFDTVNAAAAAIWLSE